MKDKAICQSSRMLALKQRAQVRNRQQTVLGRAAHNVGILHSNLCFLTMFKGKFALAMWQAMSGTADA